MPKSHRESFKIARDTDGKIHLLILGAFYIHFSKCWRYDKRSCRLVTDCVNLLLKYLPRVPIQMCIHDIDSALIHIPEMILSAQTAFQQQINVSYFCLHIF